MLKFYYEIHLQGRNEGSTFCGCITPADAAYDTVHSVPDVIGLAIKVLTPQDINVSTQMCTRRIR
jgi:hypothetical protein